MIARTDRPPNGVRYRARHRGTVCAGMRAHGPQPSGPGDNRPPKPPPQPPPPTGPPRPQKTQITAGQNPPYPPGGPSPGPGPTGPGPTSPGGPTGPPRVDGDTR